MSSRLAFDTERTDANNKINCHCQTDTVRFYSLVSGRITQTMIVNGCVDFSRWQTRGITSTLLHHMKVIIEENFRVGRFLVNLRNS